MDPDSTEELKSTNNEKDVGVTFSTNLKFNTHINNFIKKGNQNTGYIFVPHLEYVNVI